MLDRPTASSAQAKPAATPFGALLRPAGASTRSAFALAASFGTMGCLMTLDESDRLVARAQAGDKNALQALLVAHQDRVRRVVTRLLGGSAEVEDVVQEVLVQVFRSIGNFRAESKFTTWLYRVAVNVTKMHLRKLGSRPRLVSPSSTPSRNHKELTATGGPEQSLERNRRVEALYRLISALPEKKRTVLILHDLEGQRPKEIARIVGAPIMTVRTRLFYARKELYSTIAKEPALANLLGGEAHGRRKTGGTASPGAAPATAQKRISQPGEGGP